MNDVLFQASSGEVRGKDIREALKRVDATECNVLYIHSELSFGSPPLGMPRRHLLDCLLEEIQSLGVGTICMPTYTFSFCNHQPFDVLRSRSRMGALNEHFRTRDGSERSFDPLLSVAIIGNDRHLIHDIGEESIGAHSTFDKLSNRSDVRFLFLGTRLGSCFTYMHHLEWKARVPYRYNRTFTGKLVNGSSVADASAVLFVRYQGVEASDASFLYENHLANLGHLKAASIGDGPVSTVDINSATEIYMNLLDDDPNYFITEPFDRSKVTTAFFAKDMVAL